MIALLKYWKLGVLLLALGLTAYGSFRLGADHEIAKQARFEERVKQIEQAAQKGAAEAIGRIKIEHKQINRQAETVIREVPVYRDCRHDPRVERLLDDARIGKARSDAIEAGMP